MFGETVVTTRPASHGRESLFAGDRRQRGEAGKRDGRECANRRESLFHHKATLLEFFLCFPYDSLGGLIGFVSMLDTEETVSQMSRTT